MRVLQVIPDIGVANGVMSVILNYAKAMPPDITFDVAYFAENRKHGKRRSRRWAVRYIGWMLPARRICATAKWDVFCRARRCVGGAAYPLPPLCGAYCAGCQTSRDS